MSKIVFESNGTEYTMEFDRETISQAERAFDISILDIRQGKLTLLPDLFYASFLKHHPKMKQSTALGFLNQMPDKTELWKNLSQMYAEGLNELMDDPDEGNALGWTVI